RRPRTIVLSSHLIDEISDLVERVLLIDDGRLLVDESTDDLRGRAVTLTGHADQVDRFAAGRTLLHRQAMGSVASATVYGALSDAEQAEATAAGLERSPVPLQQLIVHLTKKTRGEHAHSPAQSPTHPTASSEVRS